MFKLQMNLETYQRYDFNRADFGTMKIKNGFALSYRKETIATAKTREQLKELSAALTGDENASIRLSDYKNQTAGLKEVLAAMCN